MVLFYFIALGYLILMAFLIHGWIRVEVFEAQDFPANTAFSIVVPYRDEAEHLPTFLTSLTRIKYPREKFEILLVNDGSRDDSLERCQRFHQENPQLQVRLLENIRKTGSPKKDALTRAAEKARNPYILTTDADCLVPEQWLQAYDTYLLEVPAKLVAGPVTISTMKSTSPSILFETLDVLSLQGAGVGAFGIHQPFMCNGANLCYSRKTFLEVEGFRGNDRIASGDDVFLLQKFQQKGFLCRFLKSRQAIVRTTPQPRFLGLVAQRVRWAAKAPAYTSLFARLSGAVVLLFNIGLVLGALLVLLGRWPVYPVLTLFLLKFILDFVLLYLTAGFFKQRAVLRAYFWSSLTYPFFSSFIALRSLWGGYRWKGRNFRN